MISDCFGTGSIAITGLNTPPAGAETVQHVVLFCMVVLVASITVVMLLRFTRTRKGVSNHHRFQ